MEIQRLLLETPMKLIIRGTWAHSRMGKTRITHRIAHYKIILHGLVDHIARIVLVTHHFFQHGPTLPVVHAHTEIQQDEIYTKHTLGRL